MTTSAESGSAPTGVPPGHPSRTSPTPRRDGGPRVLVVFGGRHGATREIAATLARAMPSSASGRRIGLTASLSSAQQRPDPTAYDAVVLGSAVYGGRWLEPVTNYLDAHAAALARRPTWAFSSGVWRHGPAPLLDAESSRWMHVATGPREHRCFTGRLEHRLLSASERDAVRASGARQGDHRNWHDIRGWAGEIAAALEIRAVGRGRQVA